MTYVEFFDKISSENISACLTYVPDRVIYIGNSAKLIKKHIEKYERVFRDRGHNIEFIYRIVTKSNMDSAVGILTDIVETYDDCVFDITGGEEILNLALGFVYAQHPEKNIQIHRFNLRNNVVVDCDKDGATIYRDTPTLTVEENVRIYGGDVAYGRIFENKTYNWDLSDDFVKDINTIWSICRKDLRFWNRVIGVFAAMEIVGWTSGSDALTTVARKGVVEAYLKKHKGKYILTDGFIKSLTDNNMITHFDYSDDETITVSYKNEQVKRCLTKAGQALEMKIYLTAKNLLDDDGNPVYNDAINGVVIDWDGEFHDEEEEDIYDTENEIDILLMHGVVPIFISCKSGIVTADELYKLNTVASRFGAHYSKRILIAPSISDMGEAGRYLRQRATDMDIRIIDNVQNLDDAGLAKKLDNLW